MSNGQQFALHLFLVNLPLELAQANLVSALLLLAIVDSICGLLNDFLQDSLRAIILAADLQDLHTVHLDASLQVK